VCDNESAGMLIRTLYD